tara:strand:- start:200 stop:568 length:369 start_codon:yes stop_codon:yes gene_type:complete
MSISDELLKVIDELDELSPSESVHAFNKMLNELKGLEPSEQRRALVKMILEEIRITSFVEGHVATDIECLAILLSQYFEWNGHDVATTCIAALEDSNFHTLARKFSISLEEEIKKWDEEKDE